MGKRDSGDPPPSFCAHQIGSAQSQNPALQGQSHKENQKNQNRRCPTKQPRADAFCVSLPFFLLSQAHFTWAWPWAL